MIRYIPWEERKFWVECFEQNYRRCEPKTAYLVNRDLVCSGYANDLIDMSLVVRLLETNGDILRAKGFEPWEALHNDK